MARRCREVRAGSTRVAAKLGFKRLDEYCSQSPEDARMMMADLMGLDVDDDLPPDAAETAANLPPEDWYDADHGIDYARKVADEIRRNPQTAGDADVLADLEAMLTVLTHAKERGLKWHLQVDF